jgi:hypothetical protein
MGMLGERGRERDKLGDVLSCLDCFHGVYVV